MVSHISLAFMCMLEIQTPSQHFTHWDISPSLVGVNSKYMILCVYISVTTVVQKDGGGFQQGWAAQVYKSSKKQ